MLGLMETSEKIKTAGDLLGRPVIRLSLAVDVDYDDLQILVAGLQALNQTELSDDDRRRAAHLAYKLGLGGYLHHETEQEADMVSEIAQTGPDGGIDPAAHLG